MYLFIIVEKGNVFMQYIIVPSLNPDDKLIKLVEQLVMRITPSSIIIVNDGSNTATLQHFSKASVMGCTILTHKVNKGKGEALKTAFSHLLTNGERPFSAVCCDADGQHILDDIFTCLDAVKPNSLVMGCRRFSDKTIPFRSRMGNKTTCRVFKLLCGVDVEDTQTGLRAMDDEVMAQFLEVQGSRFEFEMNMLIDTKERDIAIIQVPISTIYIEDNKTSHFNPFKDSLRIYSVFAKFLLSAILGFVVDIVVYTVLYEVFRRIAGFGWGDVFAAVIARIISSLVNFFVNKNTVFKRQTNDAGLGFMVRYYSLCVVQLSCSALLVRLLKMILPIYTPVVKIIVDSVLAVISFQVQREWVFAKPRKTSRNSD